jgi:hypothetical protein
MPDSRADAAREALLEFARVIDATIGLSAPEPGIDVERLAEAWGNVMDGRRVGTGLSAYRIGRDFTSSDDWRSILAEYARLAIPSREKGEAG